MLEICIFVWLEYEEVFVCFFWLIFIVVNLVGVIDVDWFLWVVFFVNMCFIVGNDGKKYSFCNLDMVKLFFNGKNVWLLEKM